MSSGQPLGGLDAPVSWLKDESLPEITLLDVTCDSPLPGSMPATPVITGCVTSRFTSLQHSKLSSSINLNTSTQNSYPLKNTLDLIKSNVSRVESEKLYRQNDSKSLSETSSGESTISGESNSEVRSPELFKLNGTASADTVEEMVDPPDSVYAPVRWLDARYFPEITLLEVTRESERSCEGELPSMEVRHESTLETSSPSLEPSKPNMVEIQTSAEETFNSCPANVTRDISSLSDTSVKCAASLSTSDQQNSPNSKNITYELHSEPVVTCNTEEANNKVPASDIAEPTCKKLKPSPTATGPEPSKPNMMEIQTSAEETFNSCPANVTRDISSLSDTSVKCATSLSTSDQQNSPNSKNITSELHSEPMVTCSMEEANNEELPASHDAEPPCKKLKPSPTATGLKNSTSTSLQSTQSNSSTDLNTTAEIPCPQNHTLDLPTSDVNSPKSGGEATENTLSKNTTETSLALSQNCSAVKASGSCVLQNATFESHSLHKSSASTVLGDGGAGTFCLQNNTFDAKPQKQNGTITLSEGSLGETSQHGTFDKPSSLIVFNATSTPKEDDSEVKPQEQLKDNGSTAGTEPNAKMVEAPESTFEVGPAVQVASGAGDTKDYSRSSLPSTDGLSDTLAHQNMDVENNKANPFNLDETLDLRTDPLITSTPMTNCKIFNFNAQRVEGKTTLAQKKLYGDVSSKPEDQVSSNVPSNIVCDRKTFLTQPAAKSPTSKAASQLLRPKPVSKLPGKFAALTSARPPMTRQRSQAEALRNAAALDTPQTTGISGSYKLRTTQRGSKQPNSGLQRPQLSGIPGIQRTATGLRPPTRSNSSATNKLSGPAAVTNSASKTSQARRPPLSRGETLQTAKRLKMDTPVPSGSTEVLISSCDAGNRAKNLKPPTTSQRVFPIKSQRGDATVPASTAAEIPTSIAVSRARALKQPATSQKSVLAEPKGCANCILLLEEIRRLREAVGEK